MSNDMDVMQNLRILSLIALTGWAVMARAEDSLPSSATESIIDVRILIDVSGSMKHNDPANLRAPALRMLSGLLQSGSMAGVWTYGQYVNMAVPQGLVDQAWKDKARLTADEIHSRGLFTNIEDAMRHASRTWTETDPRYQRNLIMLTDGFVDISKDAEANKASRDRIVGEILPRLKAMEVKIHTIALSREADKALLRELASSTDGWHEEIDNAEALQQVFLRLFEKTAKPDTLPLVNNQVQVDETIEEMTFLIFRKEHNTPTLLVMPDKTRFGEDKHPANVRWHHDQGYDLITVDQPAEGAWRVVADSDAGNRVVIVTNLRLNATELPNNIALDEAQHMFVRLMQQGTVITNQDFLALTDISLHQHQEDGEDWSWSLKDDGSGEDQAAGDGIFSQKLLDSLREGRHEFVLNVDGKTFQREQRQTVNVRSAPAAISVTQSKHDPSAFTLTVVPYAGLIDPETMEVSAIVSSESNIGRELSLSRTGPAAWTLELSDLDPSLKYHADVVVKGRRSGGKPVNAHIGPLIFQGDKVLDEPGELTQDTAPAEVTTMPEPEPAPESEHHAEADQHESRIDWIQVAWQVLLLNAVFIALGYFIYKKWSRTGKKTETLNLGEAE